LVFLKEAIKLMNRLGVRKVNDALTTCFEHGNVFDSMRLMKYQKPKHQVRIEQFVREAIDNAFDGFIHDKVMENGGEYHSRRIDHRLKIGNTILAIETDEMAHQKYTEIAETERYRDFMYTFPYKFVFIRFNPDDNREKPHRKTTVEDKIRILIQNITKQIDRIGLGRNIDKLEIIELFY